MQRPLSTTIQNNHASSPSTSSDNFAHCESTATPRATPAQRSRKRSHFGGKGSWVVFAFGLLGAAFAFTPAAHAEESASVSADDARPFNVGLRGQFWYAKENTLAFGDGLDFTYGLNRYVAVGAQQLFYTGFNGVEYHPLVLASGRTTLALAELRYPVLKFLAPYARPELGFSHLELQSDRAAMPPRSENPLALGAELGLEFHYWVSVRVFANLLAHPTVTEASAMTGFGLQIGARF